MDKENSGWGFFFGFLVGGVVGSVLTLWLSERVRHELKERDIDIGGSEEDWEILAP